MLRERHYLLRKRYGVILHARAPPKVTKHDNPGSIVAHLTEIYTDFDCMINKHVGVDLFAKSRCALAATTLQQLVCTPQCGAVTAQRLTGKTMSSNSC